LPACNKLVLKREGELHRRRFLLLSLTYPVSTMKDGWYLVSKQFSVGFQFLS
jgi:hypothetical protein